MIEVSPGECPGGDELWSVLKEQPAPSRARTLEAGERWAMIPSAQRLGWAAKQPLGNAALGALFA